MASVYTLSDDYLYKFKKITPPSKQDDTESKASKTKPLFTNTPKKSSSYASSKAPQKQPDTAPDVKNGLNRKMSKCSVVPFKRLSEMKSNKKSSSVSDSFGSSESVSSAGDSNEFIPKSSSKKINNVNETVDTLPKENLRSSYADSFVDKAHIYESIDPVVAKKKSPDPDTMPFNSRRKSADAPAAGYMQSVKELLEKKAPKNTTSGVSAPLLDR